MFDSIFPKHWTTLQRLMWLKTNALARAVYEIVTGNPVTFTALRAAPLRQLSVAFSPVQEGTGDPSPDNVRPISGWDSLTVEQRGRNLWNADISSDGQNIDKLTYVGQASGYAVYSFPVPANTQMRVKAITLSSLTSAILIQSTKNGADYGNAVSISQLAWAHERVLTSNSDGVLYLLTNTSPQQTITAVSESQVEIEVGTQEISEYTPYNPSSRSISINLGQTVYSGTVDVVTGVGEIDKVLIALTGTERYQYRNAEAGIIQAFWKPVDNIHPTIVTTAPVISNMFASSTSWDAASGTMSVKNSGTDSYFNFRNTAVFPANNIDGVKAKVEELYAAGTPVSAVATLATPLTIQLTPQEVQSLAGDNTMWSDANQPITVEYRKN